MSVLSSTAGVVFASTLHTGGAIGMLGGLMAYISWARGMRRGDEHVQLLNLGATITYVSILANLLGGFIRTYQPGHPKAWELFSEPWALIMVIKHIFLFAAMFAAVYLYEIVAPRLRRQAQANEPLDAPKETAAVSWVTAGILVATLLGAIVTVTPIKSMQMDDEPPVIVAPEVPFLGQTYTASGSVSGGPVPALQSPYSGVFFVPADVPFIEGSMTASAGNVEFRVTSPSGQSTLDTTDATAQDTTAEVRVDAPEPGQWTFTVTATGALQSNFQLTITVAPAVTTYLEETVTIAPGEFFEINTQADGLMAWDWTATDHLAFDIHTHFDGNLEYRVREHRDAHAGTYNTTVEGGHSYLWENEESVAVTLSYKVWGDFTVDSYYPPR